MKIDIDRSIQSVLDWDLQVVILGKTYTVQAPTLIDMAAIRALRGKIAANDQDDNKEARIAAIAELVALFARLLGLESMPAGMDAVHLLGLTAAIMEMAKDSISKNLDRIAPAVTAAMHPAKPVQTIDPIAMATETPTLRSGKSSGQS
jgi:hypothetical protein